MEAVNSFSWMPSLSGLFGFFGGAEDTKEEDEVIDLESDVKLDEVFQVCPSMKQNPITTFCIDSEHGMAVVGMASGAVDAFPVPHALGGPMPKPTDDSDAFICRRLIDKDNESVRHIYLCKKEDTETSKKSKCQKAKGSVESAESEDWLSSVWLASVTGDAFLRVFPEGYRTQECTSLWFPFDSHIHDMARHCWDSQLVCRNAHVLLFPSQQSAQKSAENAMMDDSSTGGGVHATHNGTGTVLHYANLSWHSKAASAGVEQRRLATQHANLPPMCKSADDRQPSVLLQDFDGERLSYLQRYGDGSQSAAVLRLHVPYSRGLAKGPRQAVHVVKPGAWMLPADGLFWGFQMQGQLVAYVANHYKIKLWDIGTHRHVCKLKAFPKTKPVYILAFEFVDVNTVVALATDSSVRVWDVRCATLHHTVSEIPGIFTPGYLYKVELVGDIVFYTADNGLFAVRVDVP